MTGRRLAEWEPLTPAERRVIDGLGTGHTTPLWPERTPEAERLPPADAGDDRRVRASLLRWLALGAPGDETVNLHEHGLRIAGALVVSDGTADPLLGDGSTPGVDLEGCTLNRDLGLVSCRFEHAPVLRSAHVRTLVLQGSHLPGLYADRLRTEGDVFLVGVHATRTMRLLSAHIGGDLFCHHADLQTEGGMALAADRLETRGGVFLVGVRATGEVRFLRARIGGDLVCQSVLFDGGGDKALNIDGVRITGALFWRKGSRAKGILDLTAAEFGYINDDPDCWPNQGDLMLNRCRYGAFTGTGISAGERIRWLGLQDPARFGKDFWPQPWEQCAKVLREMGHPEDAKDVLIEKERLQRADRRKPERTPQGWRRAAYRVGDALLGQIVRYGHRPLRALWFLLILGEVATLVFLVAWRLDAFKPNSPFVVRAPEWVECAIPEGKTLAAGARTLSGRAEPGQAQLDCFEAQPEGRGFPEFQAAIYAADVVLPIVDLEQQANWIPDDDDRFGIVAKWVLYLSIFAGWALSLLAVAGFAGLVKSG